MKHSARQLAIVLGVQPSTITRDIKKGRLAANKNEKGEYEIDASEIVRVYPDRVKVDDAGNIAAKAKMHDEATPDATDATDATVAKAVIQARLDAAERLLHDREQTIGDLRQRLDAEAEERRKLTALLTDKREKPAPEPEQARKGLRGFLHRLAG